VFVPRPCFWETPSVKASDSIDSSPTGEALSKVLPAAAPTPFLDPAEPPHDDIPGEGLKPSGAGKAQKW
jgi:hypothetical protein